MPTATGPVGFNSGPADEELKGHPRSVTVERQSLSFPARFLQEVAEYRPGQKIMERRLYSPDRRLMSREVYEYGRDDRLSCVKSFDETGNWVGETRYHSSSDCAIEEAIKLSPTGQELERTLTKRDQNGQVLECTITDPSDDTVAHLVSHLDDRGRPIESTMSIQGQQEFEMRIVTTYPADRCIVNTCYAPDGTLLSRTENIGDDGAVEFSQTVMIGGRTTTTRIASRDAAGNWTQKTISDSDAVVETVYRTITYH